MNQHSGTIDNSHDADMQRPNAERSLVVDALLRRAVADALKTPLTRQPSYLAMWRLKRVARYIDANISYPIHVADLAAVAKLSPSHFSRSFRASIGKSPHVFIVQHRIALARNLLANTSLTLLEIALDCGLADQPHLCRVFRRQVGMSPGAWRRRQRTRGASARSQSPGSADNLPTVPLAFTATGAPCAQQLSA